MNNVQNKWRKWMLIIALLILNIVEQAASAISGAIPQMATTFATHSQVQIELITTIVSVFVTIFVLVSGVMTRRFGQKQVAVAGLAIASISSIIPAFTTSFTLIMISRAVLGVGIGLVNPLAISLIGEFFSGDALANLMGWRSAVAGAGVAFMTFFAGQLLKVSWHASYLVYLLFFVALILFIFFVPSPEKHGKNTREKQTPSDNGITKEAKNPLRQVLTLSFLLFIYFACLMVFMIKIASFFVDAHIGTPTQASNILSVMQVTQMIGGALFGMAYKHFHKHVFVIGMLMSGITMVIISTATTSPVIMFWSAFTGMFCGLTIPYIFMRIAELSTTTHAPLNNALVLVGSNMGSFLSPYAGRLFGHTAQSAIQHAGFVILALTVIVAIFNVVSALRTRQRVTE